MRATGPWVHVGLLLVSMGAAGWAMTRDDKAKPTVQMDVTVWAARPTDVRAIRYEGKARTVELTEKTDAAGRFFVGSVEKDAKPPTITGDAGVPDAGPIAPAERTTVRFVAVGTADKLLEDLAPLKAYRDLGKVGDDRAEELGFKEPEGTLRVDVSGTQRVLTIGGPTPGGADRYARDEASGEVYVLKGNIVRSLDGAESQLMERDLHAWKDTEVTGAKLTAGGKSREVVRGGPDGKKAAWADPAKPDEAEETLGNWFTKLDRLRPSEFVLEPPKGAQVILRVDYVAAGKSLGWVEVSKVPSAEDGKKADYYLVSERTRYHAKVPQTLAEQVEQDLGSVVK